MPTQKSTMDQLLKMLLGNYDKSVRPPPANFSAHGPVLVKVNIMIRMLSKIDVVNMVWGILKVMLMRLGIFDANHAERAME